MGIVWGLVRGNGAGWGSVEVVGSMVAGALLLGAFVVWESRAKQAMLPMRLFRNRAFSAGNSAMFLTFASLFAAVFFLAQFLQTGLGNDPLGAGLRLLPWTGTLFVVAPVAGMLVDRYGERPFLVLGLGLQTIGMAWIALIADPGMSYVQMVPALMIAGCGVSMAIPAAQNAVMTAVQPEAIGKAAGVSSTLRELGGVFGIALAVAFFGAAGSYASVDAFSDGFVPATAISASLSLAGVIAALALPARPRVPASVSVPQPEGSAS